MQSRLNPYLSFKDNAREAMEFYKSVFGGRLYIDTFGESSGMPGVDANENDKVMHAMLEADNGIIFMGADTPNSMEFSPGARVSMSLSGDNEEELRGYFDKLSEGGMVHEPLAKAPWGDIFGMLRDKFGIEWMVSISTTQES